MKQVIKIIKIVSVILFILTSSIYSGTTGKIAGIITDNNDGQPLPGANITILGTSLGAATDLNGQFTILEVPPGIYILQIEFHDFIEIGDFIPAAHLP